MQSEVAMKIVLVAVATLHLGFMLAELFPWPNSLLLRNMLGKMPSERFSSIQLDLIANVVRNAGIYNGIVAGGLFYCARAGDFAAARVLLVGVVAAGIFGAFTLKSYIPVGQALLGLVGYFWPR
jgi:uncharacterized membrane protein